MTCCWANKTWIASRSSGSRGCFEILGLAFYRLPVCQIHPTHLRSDMQADDVLRAQFGDEIERCLKNRSYLEEATDHARRKTLSYRGSEDCYTATRNCKEELDMIRGWMLGDPSTLCDALTCMDLKESGLCAFCVGAIKPESTRHRKELGISYHVSSNFRNSSRVFTFAYRQLQVFDITCTKTVRLYVASNALLGNSTESRSCPSVSPFTTGT